MPVIVFLILVRTRIFWSILSPGFCREIAVRQLSTVIQFANPGICHIDHLLLVVGSVVVVHRPVYQQLPVSRIILKLTEAGNNTHRFAVLHEAFSVYVSVFLPCRNCIPVLICFRSEPVLIRENLRCLCLVQSNSIACRIISFFREPAIQILCIRIRKKDFTVALCQCFVTLVQELYASIPKCFLFLCLLSGDGILNRVAVLVLVLLGGSFHHVGLRGCIVHAGKQLLTDSGDQAGQNVFAVAGRMPGDNKVDILISQSKTDVGVVHSDKDHLDVIILVLQILRGIVIHACYA